MNLRDLRYFVAVADSLSFSRAAERCAVTQSTLSIQVRKLEDYLGVRLVARDRAHVSITLEGREVLRLARSVLASADEIVALRRGHLPEQLVATGGVSRGAAQRRAPEPVTLIERINKRRAPRV